ncbi:MAG TPA: NnrS family protein [Rhodoblastus sp.]|nr:NnrS family protein [Rhodoblastus sp.]
MTTMERMRRWNGPALFSYGFRPFFFFAAVYAAVAVLIWTLWLDGVSGLPTTFPPVAWHAHELLFGYASAVVAGFLLTAVPNWTGRLPVVGWPLVALFCLWLLGRAAMAASGALGALPLAVLTLAFPVALAVLIAREVLAGRNVRNVKVVAVLAALCLAQVCFHVEVSRAGVATYSERLALAAYLMLVMIVGGRIVPSFTTNWIKRENPGRLPIPFGRFDKIAMIVAGAALAVWVGLPAFARAAPLATLLFLAAAVLHVVRLARWAPDRVWAEKLVAVLHVAYAFIPLGFAVAAAGAMTNDSVFDIAAIHAWAIGAIGLMTLAVMTRATRGHTGHALIAPPSTSLLYLFLVVAAVARIAAAFLDNPAPALTVAGFAWSAGFAGFALFYGPMCIASRRQSA